MGDEASDIDIGINLWRAVKQPSWVLVANFTASVSEGLDQRQRDRQTDKSLTADLPVRGCRSTQTRSVITGQR